MKMCINWKVAGGLAMVGLGVALVAPGLVGAVLPLLLVAACPLSMVLMMWGMRGMGSRACASEPKRTGQPVVDARARDEQVAMLRSELANVRAQQERIERQLAELEAEDGISAVRGGVATAVGE